MANTQKVMTLADTAKLIAKVHANAAKGVRFEYDGTKGEYGNIAAYFAAHKDGKVYGVRFPKYTYSNTPTGVKTRDNANLTIEISTNAKAGRDDYAALPAFRTWDVNATVDDDGVPHVTAIDGIDTRFKRDGSNGDVYVMTCPGYYKLESTSTHNEFLYSDTQYDGYAPLPGVLLPDGSKRPCLLFAKYAASLDSQQRPLSVSGKEIDREFGSQNRAIDYALKKGKGYAGRCAGDTFYVQLMLMLKYATKNSDVLGGCWQYTPQTAVTKAETGVKRVIIATSYANNFDVGSTVNVGTDKERNNTGNYSAARARTILSKTAIDASNTALNLDGDAITTTTACFVNSMPWKTGATDKLLGTDGRPSTASAANHQPIRLQGIELFNGIYESDADLIANAVKESDVKVNLAFQIGIIGNQIHNLAAGQSFGNGYPPEKNFPARNLVHRGLQRNPRHKLVLAGFEMLGQPVDSGHNAKQPGLINHAGARQLFRHRFQRRPFRNHHIGNVKERTAFRNPPLNLHISQHRQNTQKNDNKLFHRCSLHG